MKSIIVMIMALSGVFASASRVEALEKELSPDETIEIDEISDICDALKVQSNIFFALPRFWISKFKQAAIEVILLVLCRAHLAIGSL